MRVIWPVATAPCRNRLRIRTIRQKRKDAATTETGRATVDSSKAPNAASWRRSGKIRPMPQMPGTAIRQNRAGQSVSTIFLSLGFTSGERVYSVRGDFVARRGTGLCVSYASARRPPQARIGNAIIKLSSGEWVLPISRWREHDTRASKKSTCPRSRSSIPPPQRTSARCFKKTAALAKPSLSADGPYLSSFHETHPPPPHSPDIRASGGLERRLIGFQSRLHRRRLGRTLPLLTARQTRDGYLD